MAILSLLGVDQDAVATWLLKVPMRGTPSQVAAVRVVVAVAAVWWSKAPKLAMPSQAGVARAVVVVAAAC